MAQQVPQPQAHAPCGVCNRYMANNTSFFFSCWLVHRRGAVESAEKAAGRGDDRFGVVLRGGTGSFRRRTFHLTEMLPRTHLRYDRGTDLGARRHRQLGILWAIGDFSSVEGVANQGENGQHVKRGEEEDPEASCTQCGRPLNDSAGTSEDTHVRVPVRCAHGRF